MQKRTSDDLTVLVFKDNLASRTFQFPMSWFSRLGLLAGGLTAITLVTSGLAIKYYLQARQSTPDRVEELEQELLGLKQEQQKLLAQQAMIKKQDQDAASFDPKADRGDPNSTPEDEKARPAAPTTPVSAAQALAYTPTIFSGIPSELASSTIPDRATLPIQLTQMRTRWQGNTLQVRFNIIYSASDGGNQSGRIVLLGRGPRTLIAYPDAVFQSAGSSHLIDPMKGEYFSLSRFRAVDATFTALVKKTEIQEIEVLLFNTQGRLIWIERAGLNGASSAPAPKPQQQPVQPRNESDNS